MSEGRRFALLMAGSVLLGLALTVALVLGSGWRDRQRMDLAAAEAAIASMRAMEAELGAGRAASAALGTMRAETRATRAEILTLRTAVEREQYLRLQAGEMAAQKSAQCWPHDAVAVWP